MLERCTPVVDEIGLAPAKKIHAVLNPVGVSIGVKTLKSATN